MLGSIIRGARTVLCIAVVAVTVVAARHLIFEYRHGNQIVIERLIHGQGGQS